MLFKFKIWLIDDKHAVFFAIFMVLIGLACLGGTGYYFHHQLAYKGIASKIESDSKKNSKNFSVLNEQVQDKDGGKVITYDLFMKKPFENANNVNSQLVAFTDTVKEKYNVNGDKVKAIGYRLYDRKIVYDKGLTPRGLAMYTIDSDKVSKEADKDKGNDDNTKIKQADGHTDNTDTNSILSPTQLAWQKSSAQSVKDINYKDYSMKTLNMQTYSLDSTSKPLTDQEFAFWLKMKLYEGLIGNNNIDAAAQLYLSYDLNGQVGYNNFVTISQDFEKFDKRQQDLGDSTAYYPNKVMLRQEAAIYRPQLLYYILSNGQNIESYTEAIKKLNELDHDNYGKVTKDHLNDVAKDTDKYGKVNYYAKKDANGKYVNTDPFVGTSGKYAKSLPKLDRPQFSPVLSQNNALYPLSYIPGQ